MAFMRLITPSLFRFETRHPETGAVIEVEAEYLPPRRGSRDGYGAPLEPDDPEEIVIRHVRTRAGSPVPFGDFEPLLVEEAIALAETKRRFIRSQLRIR